MRRWIALRKIMRRWIALSKIMRLLRRSGRAVCLYWTAHKTQLTIYKLGDFLPATLFPDLLPPKPLADLLTISSNVTIKTTMSPHIYIYLVTVTPSDSSQAVDTEMPLGASIHIIVKKRWLVDQILLVIWQGSRLCRVERRFGLVGSGFDLFVLDWFFSCLNNWLTGLE